MTKSLEDRSVVTDVPGDNGAGRREGDEYPKKFGHYQILRELGRGGMATVYEALDTKLQRKVAIKVPHKSVVADPEYMSRFIREARSAATLFHPNICPVFEVGEFSGTPYLTMAYIQGKNLTDYIEEENPIPAKRVAIIVRKIAQAMDVAHQQGIIHRDLKPSNIMIDARKEPVIMDFGLARRDGGNEESKLTQDGLLIGTPIYMAPEVAKKGAAFSGTVTDIYSLGAILYELLSGKPPYKGTVQAVLVQVMRGIPKPPSTYREDLDPLIEALCLKAMAKNPEDRYQTMAEFAAALKDYVQNADSAPSNLVEVVEVEPAPPQRTEPDVSKSGANRKVAVDRTPSPASRSSAGLSGRRSAVRRVKKKDNTVALVAILSGVAALAIAAAVTILIVVKNFSTDDADVSDAPAVASNTPATQSPSTETPTSNTPGQPPAQTQPKQSPLDNYPLADANNPVPPTERNLRIASNFRGMLPIQFPEITTQEGLYTFYLPRLTINDREIKLNDDAKPPDHKKLWPHITSSSPYERVNPIYKIHSDWLSGELKPGNKINVVLKVGYYYPPVNQVVPTVARRFTLHVVDPETAPESSSSAANE